VVRKVVKPYVNDGGEMFIPVRLTSYLEARRAAQSLAIEMLGTDYSSLIYNGKGPVEITDHEEGCTCDEEGCNRRSEICWKFQQ
jgi:hypothetical protein